jgi:retron-type reverse transcriptase
MRTYDDIRPYKQRHEIRNAGLGYRERQRRRQKQQRLTIGALPGFDEIVDHENLIQVFDRLKSTAGTAPGPDRVRYDMLSRPEMAQMMRDLSGELRAERYEPSLARQVKIPKSSGGSRTLRLRSIISRVVAAALAEQLTPYWETVFLPGSLGFRPNRNVWDLLCALEHLIKTQNRWVLATADIKQAFDSVNIDDALAIHRDYITDARLLDLVERVLRGNSIERRLLGIDQGSAYSPIALNILLHCRLDVPFSAREANPPWLRYADNLLYACQDVSEGQSALASATELLANAGMNLKPESTRVADLRQAETEVLGFTVKATDEVNYGDPIKAEHADPVDVSYADLINVSYDQETVSCADPIKAEYADPIDVSYTDPVKANNGQESVSYADPIKSEYADPIDVSYVGQNKVSYADEIKASYGADSIDVSYADPVKVNYDPVKVSYGISKQAWKNLAKTLSAAYQCPDPQQTASAVLRGWINGYGPTFASEMEQSIVDRIQGLAAHRGFREVSPRDLKQHIQSARVQWRSFRGRYRDKGDDMVRPLMDVAAPPAPDPAGESCC